MLLNSTSRGLKVFCPSCEVQIFVLSSMPNGLQLTVQCNALLLRQKLHDDTSTTGFDIFTIEVFSSVVMSVCSLNAHI